MFLGLSAAGALKPEMVKTMAKEPIIFAMANPDPEIWPAGRERGAARRDHRHRPLGLSQPGQQRARLPVHLPRRARRARDGDQRGDEDRRRRGAGRARARAGARKRSPRLTAGEPQLRARLHHPGAVRPAADGGGRLGRRRGGDAHRRRAKADRGHRRLPRRSCAPGSTRPWR